MKAKYLFLFVLFLGLAACNNEENAPDPFDGEYVGIFERNGSASTVELTFKNGTFQGESERVKFPALCNGKYTIAGNTITFVNECAWTAEFDWSLILNDAWEFTFENRVLTLIKPNGDRYTLTQQ